MTELNVDDLIRPQNIRKLIQRTVETYPLDWKVVHEALQNSKDAIQKNGKPGSISVVLNLDKQSVRVSDDGCGFPYDQDLLGIGGTDKDQGSDWRISGNQGVGIKAVIFSTAHFKLDSVRDGKRWEMWIDGARRYLEGRPCTLHITSPTETPAPQGTTVEYSFDDSSVTEFVNSVVEHYYPLVHDHLARDPLGKIKLALEYYFRSYSYAGDVNRLLEFEGVVPIEITVALEGKGPMPSGLDPQLARTLESNGKIEVTFENKHWDFAEAVGRTRSGVQKPTILTNPLPPGGNIGRYNDNYVYVAKFTSRDGYNSLLRNPHLRSPVDLARYERLFEQLGGFYVVIGARPVLTKYLLGPPRQFISANGVPSAHILSGPTRGGEASYVSNNIHFIADLRARLNYGKQTIANPRLVGLMSRYFDDAVRATLKNVASSLVGLQIGTSSADDIEGEEIEKDILQRPDLAGDRLAFKKVPYDENALIAIFSELVGRELLKGYNLFSLHQRARYDGRGIMKLSSQEAAPTPNNDADLRNIEFKLRLRDLISDFEEEAKFPSELSLIVTWEDSLPPAMVDYQVVDIENTPDADRSMDEVTKCLHCKRHGRYIQLLVIKDVIDRLRSA